MKRTDRAQAHIRANASVGARASSGKAAPNPGGYAQLLALNLSLKG